MCVCARAQIPTTVAPTKWRVEHATGSVDSSACLSQNLNPHDYASDAVSLPRIVCAIERLHVQIARLRASCAKKLSLFSHNYLIVFTFLDCALISASCLRITIVLLNSLHLCAHPVRVHTRRALIHAIRASGLPIVSADVLRACAMRQKSNTTNFT